MNKHALVALTLLALAGCGGGGTGTVAPGSGGTTTPASTVRSYNGSASVGDFLTITVDAGAKTIAYKNRSNGDSATVPYTVNADGTLAIADPAGNLQTAYEVPSYALLIQANKTGPAKNTPSLITAVNAGPISTTTWANQSFNYIQFRTAAGGLEIGSVAIDAAGNVSNSSYWPYGSVNNSGSAFGGGTFPAGSFVADSSGTFLTLTNQGTTDSVFGTANGMFAVDTDNGAILGLKKTTSKAFNPATAGTYKALGYMKSGANTGVGNVESGTPQFVNATITIGAAGSIAVVDASANTVVQATLTPVADAAYLVGSGKLNDPCFGLFTFRVISGSSQQDVFVTFQGNTMLFSSFTATGAGNPYSYVYGVGLKTS